MSPHVKCNDPAGMARQTWNTAVKIAVVPIMRNTKSEKIRILLGESILLNRFPIIVSTAVADTRAITAPVKTRSVF